MSEFLTAILAFPTILYTGLLGLAALYWVFVIVGAVDVNALDPSAGMDGAIKGALEGAGDAADGAIKGALEGAGDAADGAIKGASEGMADAVGAKAAKLQAASEAAGLLGMMRLKDVPVTVTGSLWLLWSWAASYLGMHLLTAPLEPILGATGLGVIVMIAAGALGIPIAAISARPLAGVFATEEAVGHAALVGQIVQISTGRVDADFGQASYEDGQGGLLLTVRCAHANKLQRGDEALLVDYDPKTGSFTVEPLDPALAKDDERRARAQARVERERA